MAIIRLYSTNMVVRMVGHYHGGENYLLVLDELPPPEARHDPSTSRLMMHNRDDLTTFRWVPTMVPEGNSDHQQDLEITQGQYSHRRVRRLLHPLHDEWFFGDEQVGWTKITPLDIERYEFSVTQNNEVTVHWIE